jgi:hypothetical protein
MPVLGELAISIFKPQKPLGGSHFHGGHGHGSGVKRQNTGGKFPERVKFFTSFFNAIYQKKKKKKTLEAST